MAKKRKKAGTPDANDLATMRYQAMLDAVNAGRQVAPTAPATRESLQQTINNQLSQIQSEVTALETEKATAQAETAALLPQVIEEVGFQQNVFQNVADLAAARITDIQGPVDTRPTLAREVFARTLAQFFPGTDPNASWINELYPVVSGYYKSGVPIDQAINLSLTDARNNPKLSTFADRFKGIYAIQDLKAAGKPVIVPTIAEYVRSESQVADLFNQAGLSDLANPQGIADVLGKGKAVSQIANEINQVFRRIDLAPQAIKDTLGRYFPTVDRSRLARTILLGDRGLQELTDELAGLEVLSAAEQQGIAATGARGIAGGVTQERAQQFARSGITYGTALPKFAEVRQTAPVEAKLAGISGRRSIGQAGVEEALLLSGAQEMEQIQQLSEEEVARFRGRSGRMEPGLASQRRANRAF